MNNDILSERRMPFSLEAEQSLLGSILINPNCLDDIAPLLSAEDFYMPEHSEIYSAMQSMYLKSKNIDVVTLIEELVQSGTYDEAGGREYLKLIAEAVPAAVNAWNNDYNEVGKETLSRSFHRENHLSGWFFFVCNGCILPSMGV